MNRRKAIRQLFVIAGGMMIATSCLTDSNSASIELKHIKLSAEDEELLKHLAEAIIPQTDSPGAANLNLHLFVMKMVDDCHSPEDQEIFIKGLENLKPKKIKSLKDAQTYLKSWAADDTFLPIVKRRTIQGYLNSEYVMKNKLIYELVPARYDGAVKISV